MSTAIDSAITSYALHVYHMTYKIGGKMRQRRRRLATCHHMPREEHQVANTSFPAAGLLMANLRTPILCFFFSLYQSQRLLIEASKNTINKLIEHYCGEQIHIHFVAKAQSHESRTCSSNANAS